MKHKKCAAAAIAAAVAASSLALSALAADDSVYVLMNIPYSAFYAAEGAGTADVDAVSSATNKTGNYGKAGGAYHSGVTAGIAGDGSVTAVGKDNGSKVKGVIWAVKADSIEAVKALGGTELTDQSKVTVATAGKGKISSTELAGYQTLSEAADYSYYVLDKAPDNYIELDGTSFKSGVSAGKTETIEVSAAYGTNWGDVQLDAGEAEGAADKIISAIVLTAEDGTQKGLYHLDQIWAFNQLGWKVAVTDGLDGKKLTNIRYYCTVKDTDNTDGAAPAYENYVYDYKTDLDISQVYRGTVTAQFRTDGAISLSGLPADAENVKAKVYYTTGGRNASYTYLTPQVVDPADDDIDPIFVDVEGSRVEFSAGSVTNKAGTTASFGTPVDGTTYTIELSSDNYIINKTTAVYNSADIKDFSGYVLMNIPYSEFYGTDGAGVSDVDAVSSATNKTGNYGKAGGAYHSGVTAGTAEDGSLAAVGKDNGSKVKGVIWAVKADSLEDVFALGGEEITDASSVTVATMGRGSTNSTELVSYQALSEASDYAFYELNAAPDNYLVLKDGKMVAGTGAPVAGTADVGVSYGTNWGDIQLDAGDAELAADKIISGIVITAEDGTKMGLYHLDQIWAFNQLAWKVDALAGLDGKKLTNIRYYCTVKDGDNADSSAPAYVNYIYDYAVDLELSQVYTGEVTAKFKNEGELVISGLPADAKNVTAKVYYTTGGRNAEYTYITPLVVDPSDDDIDPIFAALDNGSVIITKDSVTNSAGTTVSFGEPVDGTTYTVEFSCDNYIIRKTTTVYNEAENTYDAESSETESSEPESSAQEISSSESSSVSESSEAGSSSETSSSDAASSGSSSSSKASSSSSASSTSTANPNTGAAGAATGAIAVLAAAAVLTKKKSGKN